MIEGYQEVGGYLVGAYRGIAESFSGMPEIFSMIQIVGLAIAIVFISLFIWKFYNTMSKKNLLKLNLSKYNNSDHPLWGKFGAILFYLVEYIFVIPFFILLWSAVLATAIFLAVDEPFVRYVTMITAAMIIAIRILAYHKAEISKDLAKLFPFITLSVFLMNSKAVDFEFIAGQLGEIPLLLADVGLYLILIFLVEVCLRILDTMQDFTRSEEERQYISI